jgi:hypothetical protein
VTASRHGSGRVIGIVDAAGASEESLLELAFAAASDDEPVAS